MVSLRRRQGSFSICADEGVRLTTCNQWAGCMQSIQTEVETNSMSPWWVDFVYFQSANSDQREQGNANVSHPSVKKKEIWKLSFEYGRKDKAIPSSEIWTAILKGWHNKVGGRSFILIEIHESLFKSCLRNLLENWVFHLDKRLI